ncbi:MAG: hypothetical protein CFE44_25675, partial [Burkholderiales bacterium PBB4]
ASACHGKFLVAVLPVVALALLATLAVPVLAGEPSAGRPASQSLADSVAAEQLEVAARLRQRLVSDASFIAKVAAFHSTNSVRFAGMETGRQRQMIEDYLKAVRGLPWTVASDGTMTSEHWVRRESAAIFELETRAGFLGKVAQEQGMTIAALMRADALLYRSIRAYVTPAISRSDVLTM